MMQAIQISAFGSPIDVLQVVDVPEPEPPRDGEVLIGVEYAPINHNDLLLIKGTFHYTPTLQTIFGNEGVGWFLATGPGVRAVAVSVRVLPPLYSNTWREHLVASAKGLVVLPAMAD